MKTKGRKRTYLLVILDVETVIFKFYLNGFLSEYLECPPDSKFWEKLKKAFANHIDICVFLLSDHNPIIVNKLETALKGADSTKALFVVPSFLNIEIDHDRMIVNSVHFQVLNYSQFRIESEFANEYYKVLFN